MADDTDIKSVNLKIEPPNGKPRKQMTSRERMVHLVNLLQVAGIPVRKNVKEEESDIESCEKSETEEMEKDASKKLKKKGKEKKPSVKKEIKKSIYEESDQRAGEQGVPRCDHGDLQYKGSVIITFYWIRLFVISIETCKAYLIDRLKEGPRTCFLL